MNRVFLHIGLHKTGTTYLQNLIRANRDQLGAQGVFFPGGTDTPLSQMLAAWDLLGRRRSNSRDGRITGQWALLVAQVGADTRPVTLVSDEHLSLATAAQARRAVASFPGHEVHVVVTARDLGRVVLSAWQEEVKHNQTWTWQEFLAAIRDPDRRGVSPARGFWLRQDLPAILERWAGAVPEERIHLVTVPTSGGDELLQRFAGVVGIDPRRLTNEPRWDNQTLGVAGTELIRRLNDLLDHRLNERQYNRVVNAVLVRALSRNRESERLALPASELGWLQDWTEEATAHIDRAGYRVVGDLAELRPSTAADGSAPGTASTDELLEAAMTALAELSANYARAWWSRKKPDVAVEGVSGNARLASLTRGVGFRTRRLLASQADRHPAMGRALGGYLRMRRRPWRRNRR